MHKGKALDILMDDQYSLYTDKPGQLRSILAVGIPFITLLLFIDIPEPKRAEEKLLAAARKGLVWPKEDPIILTLILYLACVNLAAFVYDAALPAMALSKQNGGETALGLVNTCAGIAMLAGSVFAAFLSAPKNRLKVISVTLLLPMSGENFLLAFGKTPLARGYCPLIQFDDEKS